MSDLSMAPSNDFLTVAAWPRGRTWLIELRGELDISSRDALECAVVEAPPGSTRCVVVDARGVTFIDGGGLHALLSAAVACRCEVWLRAPSAPVCRIAELVGLALDAEALAAGDDVRLA